MLTETIFRRALRDAAPNLTKRFFTCQAQKTSGRHLCGGLFTNNCSRTTVPPCTKRAILKDNRSLQGVFRKSITSQTRGFQQFTRVQDAAAQVDTFAGESARSKWPETDSNAVAYWLLASAASVFGIVVFGGLTRLTESGLSITEWRPVTGSFPPLSQADWDSEFGKYKASPEFKVLNSRMTLEEFKFIYYMEWIHRLWGRFVGLSFVLPAVYFVSRKQVSLRTTGRLTAIAGLIGFQGFIGWWMVKSGLKDDFLTPGQKPGRDVPRVSQYRLAAHLGTAFVAYLSMLWTGLDILRTNKLVHKMSPEAAGAALSNLRNPALRTFKLSVALLLGLTFTTAMSGALVAGLDAGLIYNEFPYMGLGLTPPKAELFNPFYSHDPTGQNRDLIWRNMLENPSLVQLDHRILATSTFTAVMALFAYSRFSQTMRAALPRSAMRGVHGVFGFVWLQVILGISTLIYMVPVPLASAHQAGALALLSWTLVLGSRVWIPRHAAQIIARRTAMSIGPTADLVGTHVKPFQTGVVLQAGLSATATALGSATLAVEIQRWRGSGDGAARRQQKAV